MNTEFLKLLICPDCKFSLIHNNTSLRCRLCNQDFPINNGIPSLLTTIDTQEAEQLVIYEDTHKSDTTSLGYIEYTEKIFFQVINFDYFLPRILNKNLQGKLVLDIGSGCRNLGKHISEAGAQIVNIDISSKALERARSFIFNAKADYVQGSILKIPLADSSVDLVIAYFVLHHIEDTKKAISEIKRVLKPGGYFICIEPTARLTWMELWLDFFKIQASLKKLAEKTYKILQNDFAKNGSVKGMLRGQEARDRRHFLKNFDEYKEVINEAELKDLKMKTIFLEFLPPRYFESNKKFLVRTLFKISDTLLRNVSSFAEKGKFIVMEARKT